MNPRWLWLAAGDLENVFDHIAEDDIDAAERTVDTILDAVECLVEFPGSGRPGRVVETRELVVGTHIVAYRVRDGIVEILRVLHRRRKWPDIL